MNISIPFVCISLDRAQDRRALMARQFEAHGIDAKFFSGIEPRSPFDDIPEADISARMRRYGRPLTKGEIGCYLSHREVWKQLVNSTDEVCCVMEDDISLRDGFADVVRDLAANREHWDVVRLMGLNWNVRIPFADLPSGAKLMWMDRQPVGAQCYVITREAAARLLQHTERMIHAIDTAIDRHWQHGLRLLITSPEFVELTDSESTVGYRPGVTSLSMRIREKIYRRIDKIAAAHYNARHRPRQVIKASGVVHLDQAPALGRS